MGISVLLVSTATRWFGTARMPRVLARAGFDVALLAPRGSLAEKSRFVGTVGHLPDSATPKDWIYAFAATAKATAPRVVIPCDDMAFRLLDLIAQSPPDDMASALQLQLGALIRESLGDLQHHATMIEKTLLPTAAHALGIRVAEHATEHIRGPIWYENVAAWQGKRLAGFAVDRLVAQRPGPRRGGDRRTFSAGMAARSGEPIPSRVSGRCPLGRSGPPRGDDGDAPTLKD